VCFFADVIIFSICFRSFLCIDPPAVITTTPIQQRLNEFIATFPNQLSSLSAYTGCMELAKIAMSQPNVENETRAFEGLLESVRSIAYFYSFSKELETNCMECLQYLTQPTLLETKNFAQENLSILYSLCDMFAMAMEWDEIRMHKAYLPNDFSYYRRLYPKFSKHPNITIKEEEASSTALFTAYVNPMNLAIQKAYSNVLERNPNVVYVLVTLVRVCHASLLHFSAIHPTHTTTTTSSSAFSPESPTPDRRMYLARVTCAALLAHDCCDATGIFSPNSPFKLRKTILLWKRDLHHDQYRSLCNSLQYQSKHFKDAKGKTRHLLEED
jgi:hypothetical protein